MSQKLRREARVMHDANAAAPDPAILREAVKATMADHRPAPASPSPFRQRV